MQRSVIHPNDPCHTKCYMSSSCSTIKSLWQSTNSGEHSLERSSGCYRRIPLQKELYLCYCLHFRNFTGAPLDLSPGRMRRSPQKVKSWTEHETPEDNWKLLESGFSIFFAFRLFCFSTFLNRRFTVSSFRFRLGIARLRVGQPPQASQL